MEKVVVEINGYFVGFIFKDDVLIRNTIPLSRDEISRFFGWGKVSNKKHHIKMAEYILKLYFGEMLDREVRELINYSLDVSPFTKKVLEVVKDIPYGKVRTYGEIARELNTSPRAVGGAMNKNPLPLIIPCHRVVGKNNIGGYSYGIRHKINILKNEGIIYQ
ncbi:MGMT family protein [Methanotorris igneus]|uniref:Methylated-DNA--protein-cysteine methyltransferase n=1 Tax=Methanotorris igneus (strain DSM 5666 / JCM 11834 / Kol 5) TaxID=880724 RepID=F6BB33_METIK|nr:Methylated-DNA--protein-cysteine methyltransferase [Methanotorris igneus Kol 5]